VKPRDILTVKNACVKTVCCVSRVQHLYPCYAARHTARPIPQLFLPLLTVHQI